MTVWAQPIAMMDVLTCYRSYSALATMSLSANRTPTQPGEHSGESPGKRPAFRARSRFGEILIKTMSWTGLDKDELAQIDRLDKSDRRAGKASQLPRFR